MNIELANKIADVVQIIEKRDGFEAAGEIQTGIDLASNTPTARVISDGIVVMNWVSADGKTVRAAEAIVQRFV
jgi:hypothetical protein